MKFLRFKRGEKIELGVFNKEENAVINLSDVFPGRKFSSMQDVIENVSDDESISKIKSAAENAPLNPADLINVRDIKILAPISKPIHDILCVGVNYSSHLLETKERVKNFKKETNDAVYFSKRAVEIIGDKEPVKAHLDIDSALDYEVELAVVIGKTGRDIKKEEAEDYIFGYSIFNDFSSRRLQMKHVQWFRGKSLDTYSAMGPVILHKSALPFPVEADVKCSVNGELRQDSNTRLFLHDIAEIIADLSSGMTLEAGDIIATGTPSGVGMGYKPGKWLKKGDKVICEIPQIGRLENDIE